MIYRDATFELSVAQLSQLPADTGYEVAFAGRSNAGKSSVINTLTDQKALARTSKTPGRTQLINVFSLDDERRLMDLPGYGYAKVPERIKEEWQKLLDQYLRSRESLRGIILIMDIRHPLKPFDQMMLEWSYACGLPIHILLNKADKLKKGPAKNTLLAVQKELKEFENLITIQLFSALKKTGKQECYQFLDKHLAL